MQQELLIWETRFISYLQAHLNTTDGSHDLYHFKRVWKMAQHIAAEEGTGADLLIILAGAYFHDFIALPKDHPDAAQSSRLAAEKTALILRNDFPDFPVEKIAGVSHVIHAHSFSARVAPLTAEARILQDADRMEALGAIGIARVFYTAGLLHKDLFEPEDPLAAQRPLNDREYALDHFQQKLLKLPELMNTASGKQMALQRAVYIQGFMTQLVDEIRL